jgi:uncharacterized protein with FMN-binding domain
MKKLTVAVIIVGVFIFYSIVYNYANSAVLPPNSTTEASSSTRTSSVSSTAAATSPQGAAGGSSGTQGTTSAPGSNAVYKDGSYTGSPADAQYGYIQVKAIIKNGKITDVQFLQAPNDRNRSIMINQYADPQLTSEAIQAQNANVDIITGATDSSEAFIQSLSDALTQAKA